MMRIEDLGLSILGAVSRSKLPRARLSPVNRRRRTDSGVESMPATAACQYLVDAVGPYLTAHEYQTPSPRYWNLFPPARPHIGGGEPSHTRPCRASAESGCQRWADRMGQHLVVASVYWAPVPCPL
ncbi:hypothetical protein ACQKWADRAFT_91810 [Trichoderma austrokoningii]